MDLNFAEEVFKEAGIQIHQTNPLELIDKVGFLRRGEEATDLCYDACVQYINKHYVSPERERRLGEIDAIYKQLKEADNGNSAG